MFVTFNEEARKIIKLAIAEKDKLNHPYLGSEHIILALLKQNNVVKRIFRKNKVNYSRFKNRLISVVGKSNKKAKYLMYTPLLKKILLNTVLEAREQRKKYVTPSILATLILEEHNGSACTILELLNVNISKIIFDLRNNDLRRFSKGRKLLLDELGTDLTAKARTKCYDPVLGRDKEIKLLCETLLRRKKNNPILIGDAGVGKTAIVEGLANLIVSKKVPKGLMNKRIISLNIYSLVAGTKYRGEFEEKMKKLIKELEENKNIILFIDEIHTIVGAGGAEGAIDASNIFKPALARGNIKIIGATTTSEYDKYIRPDGALSRRFGKIIVEEPSKEDLKNILLNLKPIYEKYHVVSVPDCLINDLINLSEKYLVNQREPDRSISVLDDLCSKVATRETNDDLIVNDNINKLRKIYKMKEDMFLKKEYKKAFEYKDIERKLKDDLSNKKRIIKQVRLDDLKETISLKTNCIMVDGNYYEKLRRRLNSKLINQKENISKIIDLLKLRNYHNKKEPFILGVFGAKGSGKSYFSKVLAKELSKNVIYLDMKNYSNSHSINNMVSNYNNNETLIKKVKTNPFSAIVLDNFEKANYEVRNIFFDILKTGSISTPNDGIIDFSNTIIIINNLIGEDKKLGFNNSSMNDNELSVIKNKIFISRKGKEDTKKILKDKIKKHNFKESDFQDIFNQINDNFDLSILDEMIENKINKLVLNN